MSGQRILGTLILLVAASAVGAWVVRLQGPIEVNGVRLGMTQQEVTEVLGDPHGSERNELDYARFFYEKGRGKVLITFRAGRVYAIQGTSIKVGNHQLVSLGDPQAALLDSDLFELLGTPVTQDTGADMIIYTWGEPSGPNGEFFILVKDSQVHQIIMRGAYDAPEPPPPPPGGGHG